MKVTLAQKYHQHKMDFLRNKAKNLSERTKNDIIGIIDANATNTNPSFTIEYVPIPKDEFEYAVAWLVVKGFEVKDRKFSDSNHSYIDISY